MNIYENTNKMYYFEDDPVECTSEADIITFI